MNTVSTDLLTALRSRSTDFNIVVEFYESDGVPTSSGFDPGGADCLAGYAQVDGVVFRGRVYDRQVKSVSGLRRTTGKDFNSCSVTFTNLDYTLADFHLTEGIEGLLMVVRLLSRKVSLPRAAHRIVWSGLTHGAVSAGNTFRASGGDDNWNPGASSDKSLTAGVTGSVGIIVGSFDSERMFGLGTTNTGGGFSRINHAMYLINGVLIAYESGSNMGVIGSYAKGDDLRVVQIGTLVYMSKNGSTIYTSGVASGGTRYANGTVKLNNTQLESLTLIGFGAAEDLDDSIVLFTGRCEKAVEASRNEFKVTAKHIIGSIDVELPRRKFTYDDAEGRSPADVLFEGFRFMPQVGNIQYQTREARGGLASLLGLKKTVTRSLQYSAHSALDAEKPVPLLLGRAQLLVTHLAYVDYGNSIAMVSAVCDGGDYGIHAMVNLRNVSPQFTPIIVTIYSPQYRYGLAGNTGTGDRAQVKLHYTGEPTATDPWPGDGYYSRTAFVGSFVNGSQISSDDPAPDLAVVAFGMWIDLPDSGGDYVETGYSDNPIHQARFILHSPTHMGLDDGWFDDAALITEADYCDQILVDNASSDAALLPIGETGYAGTDYKYYKSSGVITPDWYKYLNGETVDPFSIEADYEFYTDSTVPIEPIDPPDPPGPGQVVATGYRRRYTSNVLLTETMPAVDFLYDVLFPAARLYLTQAASGQLRVKVKRPADNTLVRIAPFAFADEIAVYDVIPWRNSQRGKALVGAHRTNSEVRTITGGRFTSVSNSITTTASGGASFANATLEHADDANSPGEGLLTVTSTAGEKRVIIDGYDLRYTPAVGDTVETIAGMIKDQINSHPVLSKYIVATWTVGSDDVGVYSKLGFIQFGDSLNQSHAGPIADPTTGPTAVGASGGSLLAGDYQLTYSYVDAYGGETLPSDVTTVTVTADQKINVTAITPLPTDVVSARWYISLAPGSNRRRLVADNSGAAFSILAVPSMTAGMEPQFNSASEEVIRVEMAFSDRELDQSDATRADILRGSAKWPLGGSQSSINQIELAYRDAVQDWRLTNLTIRDDTHQTKVKKKLPKKINGAAIDSYHQAARIANGLLAELRDGDFFHAWEADGEALLLEEGDVVCLTDESGGFINSPCRIEAVNISVEDGFPKVAFTARKYATHYYDDRVTEKNIPLPSTLIGLTRRNASETITPECGILGVKEAIDLSNPFDEVVYTCPVGYAAYIFGYGFEPFDGPVFHHLFSINHGSTDTSLDIVTDTNYFWSSDGEFKYLPVGADLANGYAKILLPGEQIHFRGNDAEKGSTCDFYTFGFLKPYNAEDTYEILTDESGLALTDESGAALTLG